MGEFIGVFLFFLPAGISNMAPVIVNKIPIINNWNTPLDFGLKRGGKRLLGDNKRLRGLIIGTLLGGLTAVLVNTFNTQITPDNTFFIGCLLGFGALTGDAVESFFKRKQNINPGESWFPFDQLDYIVGGLVFVFPFYKLSVVDIVSIFVVYFSLHIVSAYLGFWLGLKDKPI